MTARRQPRAVRVQQVSDLRAMGYSYKEISAQIGLAVETIMSYMSDPEGESLNRYRRSRWRDCPSCGGVMKSITAKRCHHCSKTNSPRYRWTPERVIGGLQRYYFEHGDVPTADGVLRHNMGHYPIPSAVVRAFGTWSEGVAAAGFTPKRKGFKTKEERLLIEHNERNRREGIDPSLNGGIDCTRSKPSGSG